MACYKIAMNTGWYERFVGAIRDDGRDYTAISKAAGLGQNYVQQMIKNGKRPTVDKFLAILNVLGSASAIFVLTGYERDQESEDIMRAFAAMDPALRDDASRFLRALAARQHSLPPPSDS